MFGRVGRAVGGKVAWLALFLTIYSKERKLGWKSAATKASLLTSDFILEKVDKFFEGMATRLALYDDERMECAAEYLAKKFGLNKDEVAKALDEAFVEWMKQITPELYEKFQKEETKASDVNARKTF